MMTDLDREWLPTRQTLLSRLKDRDDSDSWREFFETYSRLIYGVARRAGLDETEAQEVVQETLITVANKLPEFRYDPKKGSFKGWLRHTARWRIQDQLRKRQRDERLREATRTLAGVDDPSFSEKDDPAFDRIWLKEWEEHLMKAAIARVKKQVDPREFQVFDFCTLKGWPAARVARELNLFRPRVYYLNKKVTRLLRREMVDLQSQTPV
jgi:RNA polymerase sigma factor (sigma-70 family)